MGTPTMPPTPEHAADPDPSRPGDPLAALADYLDPPEPGASLEVDLAAAAAIVAEVRAARVVVAAARQVGHPDLDDTDVAERLADALDAYDHATNQGRRSP
jgi:hypothetical protein